MFVTLFQSPSFAAFVLAGLILAITPGPAVIYLVTQTLTGGRRAGFASIGGVALGNLGNASMASFGLAAIFAASATAFAVVKYAGAAYLIYLGIKALRSRLPSAEVVTRQPVAARRLFRDGFFVALLNPKTALFFAALLPQFISPAAPPLGQSIVLGAVFVAIALCTDSLYVCSASAIASNITRRSAWRPYGRYLSAASFIGLGIYAAVASPRSTR